MHDIAAIVAAHGDVVWRIAVQLLSNDEDARDCYQQTFLDAVRLSDKGVTNWRSLLASIATRRAMDQLRRRYREREMVSTADVEPFGDSPPDRRILDEELRQRIRAALASLPVAQAEAFWLRHVEDLATGEVARQLELKPGHVRVLVHRAVEHLRAALTPVYGHQSAQGDCHEDP
jgi:RNA polymerase sigma-70 factor (ECF subfamily)